MKRLFLCFVCCAVSVFLVSASSAAGMYFAGKAGVTMPEDSDVHFDSGLDATFEMDTGFAFSAAIGGQINRNIRIEPELSYQQNDFDRASAGGGSISVDGDAYSLSLMANLYYDFIPEGPVTPYLGGGFGIAWIDVSDITSPSIQGAYLKGDEDSVLAFQGNAGIGWHINDKVIMDFMYRYYVTEDAHFDIADAEFESHNVYVGIRAPF